MENLYSEIKKHPFVKINSDDEFNGSYGILQTKLPAGRIVKFGPGFASLFRGEYEKGTHTKCFDIDEIEEIEVLNLFDYLKLKAKQLYGNNDYDIVDLEWKFSLENDCMCHSCDEKADQRILHKIELTVIAYDVCSGHAYFDGKDENEFTFIVKRNYQPRVKELIK